MKKKLYLSGIFVYLLLLNCLVLAQSPNSDAKTPPSKNIVSNQISEADLIHFGDLLEVDIVGSLEYDWRGKITSEGFLNGMPLLDEPVYGLCKRPEEVAEQITKSYRKFLRDPRIVVKILDRSNRPTSVLYGAVKNQQRFQITRPIFLNELIIISGGLTDRASGEIQIFRPRNLSCFEPENNGAETVEADFEHREKFVKSSQDNGSNFINIKISDLLTGKKDSNPQILSGDIITVLAAQPIYVIGGVENPKQISSRSVMTLTRAISSAGGLSKDADETRIIIFRRKDNETIIIEADLKKIKAGQTEDITLKPYDVVDVSKRGRKEKTNPPILENPGLTQSDDSNLPLRIID